jgi:nondiscriminating aspartyl-tRNA synthetase
MSRVLCARLPEHVGQQVTIAGWLHRRRELKSVTFLIVRDRSGLAQVVLNDPAEAGTGAETIEMPEETVIEVTGTVTANPQAPGGA